MSDRRPRYACAYVLRDRHAGCHSLDVLLGALRSEIGRGRPHKPERIEALTGIDQPSDPGPQQINTFDPANLLEILLDPLTVPEIRGRMHLMQTAVHPIDQERPVAHRRVQDFAGAQVALALAIDHPAQPVRADVRDHHRRPALHWPPGQMPFHDPDGPFLRHHGNRLWEKGCGGIRS